MNLAFLKTCYASHQFRTATTDEQRMQAADQLVNLGPAGLEKLMEFLHSGNYSCQLVAGNTLGRCLGEWPDGDPRAILVGGQLLNAFPNQDAAGQKLVLGLLSNILKRSGTTDISKCREAVASGLKLTDPESRLQAIRLALHPDLKMRTALLPLLNDSEPRVRAAALFGVASFTGGEHILSDEELFRWLHDPDEGVRKVCYDALVGEGRSEVEITLARRLAHPDPNERLKLLYDLRYEDEIPDPEPWLERLSRDQEPAIRAGSARVVLEVMADRKQGCPGWVSRLTDTDPDPTVRRVAGFFRREMSSSVMEVRPVSAP
jgi:HEAT repeat protein